MKPLMSFARHNWDPCAHKLFTQKCACLVRGVERGERQGSWKKNACWLCDWKLLCRFQSQHDTNYHTYSKHVYYWNQWKHTFESYYTLCSMIFLKMCYISFSIIYSCFQYFYLLCSVFMICIRNWYAFKRKNFDIRLKHLLSLGALNFQSFIWNAFLCGKRRVKIFVLKSLFPLSWDLCWYRESCELLRGSKIGGLWVFRDVDVTEVLNYRRVELRSAEVRGMKLQEELNWGFEVTRRVELKGLKLYEWWS